MVYEVLVVLDLEIVGPHTYRKRTQTKGSEHSKGRLLYYPPEVRRGKYWGLGVFLLQYFLLVKI